MDNFFVPSYSDLFEEPIPEISILLIAIPSKPLLAFIAKINFELHFEQADTQIQLKIFEFWCMNISAAEKSKLNNKLQLFSESLPPNSNMLLFGKHYLLKLIDKVLLQFNVLQERILTSQEVLNTLKAYFLIVESEHDKDQLLLFNSLDKYNITSFDEIAWPHLMRQFEKMNYRPDVLTEFIKIFAVLETLFNSPDLRGFLHEFLRKNDLKNIGDFITTMIKSYKNLREIYEKYSFEERYPIIETDGVSQRFQNLSIIASDYGRNAETNINFKLLRERPLLQVNENRFIVLNMAFYFNKIYIGFLFDLYYYTTLSQDHMFRDFADFKTIISKKVMEGKVFKRLFQRIFSKAVDVLYFEEKENISIPDCYLRVKTDIYFLEFKDYLLKGELFDSNSYEDIKKGIDEKFVNGKKGTQLKRQFQNFLEGKFKFDKEIIKSKEEIILYPIIVHTNFAFSMPRVQQYLAEHLNSLLNEIQVPGNFRIANLTLINLKTFLTHFENLRQKPAFLGTLIQRYCQTTFPDEEEFLRFPSFANYIKAFRSFDMEYETQFVQELLLPSENMLEVIMYVTGVTQEIFDHPLTTS